MEAAKPISFINKHGQQVNLRAVLFSEPIGVQIYFSKDELQQIVYNAGYEVVELKERSMLPELKFGDEYFSNDLTKILIIHSNLITVKYVYLNGVTGSRSISAFHENFKKVGNV